MPLANHCDNTSAVSIIRPSLLVRFGKNRTNFYRNLVAENQTPSAQTQAPVAAISTSQPCFQVLPSFLEQNVRFLQTLSNRGGVDPQTFDRQNGETFNVVRLQRLSR